MAEAVLPHVEELAQRCEIKEVVLVSVTERVKGMLAVPYYGYPGTAKVEAPVSRPAEDAQEVPVGVGKKQRQAERYLNRIAKQLEAKGIRATTEVLLGDPAEEIGIYTELRDVDLIAMSSHGRSGIRKWAHGSVADRVFRSVNVPVLMVRAPAPKQAPRAHCQPQRWGISSVPRAANQENCESGIANAKDPRGMSVRFPFRRCG